MGEKKNSCSVWWRNQNEREHVEDVGVKGRILLKCVLKKQDERMLTRFIQLKEGEMCRTPVNTVRSIRLHKKQGFPYYLKNCQILMKDCAPRDSSHVIFTIQIHLQWYIRRTIPYGIPIVSSEFCQHLSEKVTNILPFTYSKLLLIFETAFSLRLFGWWSLIVSGTGSFDGEVCSTVVAL